MDKDKLNLLPTEVSDQLDKKHTEKWLEAQQTKSKQQLETRIKEGPLVGLGVRADDEKVKKWLESLKEKHEQHEVLNDE